MIWAYVIVTGAKGFQKNKKPQKNKALLERISNILSLPYEIILFSACTATNLPTQPCTGYPKYRCRENKR